MKIGGKTLPIKEEDIVIPRDSGEMLVMKAVAINDGWKEFKELCPEPEPPAKILPGGRKQVDYDDENYKKDVLNYGKKQTAYVVIKSLILGTPDIEWELVKLGDSGTWLNYMDDLRAGGLSEGEVAYVINKCTIVNTLDESLLEKARESFLQGGRSVAKTSSSQTVDRKSGSSGKRANRGESNPGNSKT